MSVPICLADKRRKGIGLALAPLPLLQTLRNLGQQPDVRRVVGFAKPGIKSPAKSRGSSRDNEPSSTSAMGSTSTEAGGSKTSQVSLHGANPVATSLGKTAQRRGARKYQNPRYRHHDVFLSPAPFRAPAEGDVFF